MANSLLEKLHLSAKGLLNTTREVFQKIKEPVSENQGPSKSMSIECCLMSALAVFKLKFPSLLQFEESTKELPLKQNLKNLFKIKDVPSDTYMRERLDEIAPDQIRPAFTAIFSSLQRGKQLEKYVFLDGKYLMLNDGTGYFSSKQIHCENCCKKHHKKDNSITYYHQMLGSVIAHPDYKEVIPLCPEPIMNEDGSTKNDCERNASERLLRDFRREHPHLPVILVEDALSSNGPHLKLLKELDISFITVVKADGNKALFDYVETFDWQTDPSEWDEFQGGFLFTDDKHKTHKFRYANRAPLNDSHSEFKVNYLEYWEIDATGQTLYHNSWITDTWISNSNAYMIARGGRARWHIENETFNTLKNQGYHFEHNFGHGYKHLSTLFARLMMLAFLIDQAEQLCCGLFQGALKKFNGKKSSLWRRVRGFFEFHIVSSWKALYLAIMGKIECYSAILDTS